MQLVDVLSYLGGYHNSTSFEIDICELADILDITEEEVISELSTLQDVISMEDDQITLVGIEPVVNEDFNKNYMVEEVVEATKPGDILEFFRKNKLDILREECFLLFPSYLGDFVMSTHCTIGKKDGNMVKAIYCHFDGYPSGVGATLKEHYQDENKVDKLISLGGISYLCEDVAMSLEDVDKLTHRFENGTVCTVNDGKIIIINGGETKEVSIFDARYTLGTILKGLNIKEDEINDYVSTFDSIMGKVTLAYHRDRGEPLHILELSVKEMEDFNEYNYLFDSGIWYLYDGNEWRKL